MLLKVGPVAKTSAPDPVSSVTAAARFADDGVPRNVATFAPRPETPVETGKPVQLVKVPDVGVPKIGVTKVGVLAKTNAPVPVSSVTAAIKFALLGVAKKVATFAANPATPVEMGNPVQLVNVPEVGVPRIGVTRVGEVLKTSRPVPVSLVIAAARFALVGLANQVCTPAA